MNIGLLILLMLGLKLYVGAQRGKLKLPSGETNPEFNRVTRVQLNAVEDVPVLMVGIAASPCSACPPGTSTCAASCCWSRVSCTPTGLAGSSGFSIGRAVGTMGTMLVFLAIAGALLVHAFI